MAVNKPSRLFVREDREGNYRLNWFGRTMQGIRRFENNHSILRKLEWGPTAAFGYLAYDFATQVTLVGISHPNGPEILAGISLLLTLAVRGVGRSAKKMSKGYLDKLNSPKNQPLGGAFPAPIQSPPIAYDPTMASVPPAQPAAAPRVAPVRVAPISPLPSDTGPATVNGKPLAAASGPDPLAARKNELDRRERQLNDSEAALRVREGAVNFKEVDVEKRERAIIEERNRLDDARRALQDARAAFEEEMESKRAALAEQTPAEPSVIADLSNAGIKVEPPSSPAIPTPQGIFDAQTRAAIVPPDPDVTARPGKLNIPPEAQRSDLTRSSLRPDETPTDPQSDESRAVAAIFADPSAPPVQPPLVVSAPAAFQADHRAAQGAPGVHEAPTRMGRTPDAAPGPITFSDLGENLRTAIKSALIKVGSDKSKINKILIGIETKLHRTYIGDVSGSELFKGFASMMENNRDVLNLSGEDLMDEIQIWIKGKLDLEAESTSDPKVKAAALKAAEEFVGKDESEYI